MSELDELKKAIIDALSGKQERRSGAPRQQWEIDMERADNERRAALDAEIDEALGIDRNAPYTGHISKPRTPQHRNRR